MNWVTVTPGSLAARLASTLLLVNLGVTLPSTRQVAIPDFTTSESGNPFVDGWYADPDTEFYNNEYWVFPTSSYAYEQQTYLDAFSSPDLVNWTKHPNILTDANVTWATKAMWAPAPISRNGKYYLYFGANDIQEDEAANGLVGGIGVAIADTPEGPYVDAIGAPLIGDYFNGAQPIDQDVFIDDDGQAYIYYGGHSHANVAKINEDMISIGTFDDDTVYREITPENYVEGPQMIKRKGVYYLMWSEGGWTGPDYAVSYAMSDNPLGPFERVAKILQQDSDVAKGSGHNAVINIPGTDIWYIVYHRRPLNETDGNHREICYDRMYFNEDGTIQNIDMLVKDNFADGQMIAWKTSGSGKWTVEDQKLEGSASEGLAIAMLDTNFTDVVFDAVVNSSDFLRSVPSLIFRASGLQGEGGYYWAKLHGDRAEFGIASQGTDTVLGKGSGSFKAGLDHKVRVIAVGSEVKIFVDDMGAALFTATDATLTIGANGVAVSGTATFDDISVASP